MHTRTLRCTHAPVDVHPHPFMHTCTRTMSFNTQSSFLGSIFQIIQCSRHCIISIEIYVTHSGCAKLTANDLETWHSQFLFKMKYIIDLSFLRLSVSIVLMFFVFHEFNIIQCLNVWVLPKKTTVTVRETEESQFFANWDLSCKWFFWHSVF